MKQYNIYFDDRRGKLIAVKAGFCWPCLFFGVLYIVLRSILNKTLLKAVIIGVAIYLGIFAGALLFMFIFEFNLWLSLLFDANSPNEIDGFFNHLLNTLKILTNVGLMLIILLICFFIMGGKASLFEYIESKFHLKSSYDDFFSSTCFFSFLFCILMTWVIFPVYDKYEKTIQQYSVYFFENYLYSNYFLATACLFFLSNIVLAFLGNFIEKLLCSEAGFKHMKIVTAVSRSMAIGVYNQEEKQAD